MIDAPGGHMPEQATATEQQPQAGEPGTAEQQTGQHGGQQNGQQSASSEQPGEDKQPEKYADVLAGLDEHSRQLVQAEWNKKNNEAKNLRTRLTEAEPKARAHDEAQAAQQSAEEQAAQRERAANERAAAAVQRMVRSEVRALASDKFADPDDAAAFIDASQYLGGDGEPDTEGIRSALDDLLTRKPHLAKQERREPRPPAPNPAQGSSSSGPATPTGPDRAKQLYEARHGRKATAS